MTRPIVAPDPDEVFDGPPPMERRAARAATVAGVFWFIGFVLFILSSLVSGALFDLVSLIVGFAFYGIWAGFLAVRLLTRPGERSLWLSAIFAVLQMAWIVVSAVPSGTAMSVVFYLLVIAIPTLAGLASIVALRRLRHPEAPSGSSTARPAAAAVRSGTPPGVVRDRRRPRRRPDRRRRS
jgi:hypothetical protein